jgi:hypothetical protein
MHFNSFQQLKWAEPQLAVISQAMATLITGVHKKLWRKKVRASLLPIKLTCFLVS